VTGRRAGVEEDPVSTTVKMDAVYVPSEDVVAREIEGELILVPIVSGIGDMEDALFTLNETGRAIWDRLDGKTSLKDVVDGLAGAFEASGDAIKADVVGFMEEVVKRGIVVESKGQT
jgi:hypothetical protein